MKYCENCGQKLRFKIINNKKVWIYGTISLLVVIFGFFLMIVFKLVGLIIALLLSHFIWNWYTHHADYIGYCENCVHKSKEF